MADTYYQTSAGDMLDEVCQRFYGQQSGAVETVLAANRGLADLGPVLPVNIKIVLPEISAPEKEAQPLRLWD